MQDDTGNSALMCAVDKNLCSVVEKLVSTGTKCKLTDLDGLIALLLACAQWHIDTVELLVTPTADVGALDVQNDKGYRALMCCGQGSLRCSGGTD